VRRKGKVRVFPAENVGPLVDQHRQIPIALDPLAVHVPDDRLGGGAEGQPLLQLFTAGLGHPGQFGVEAFHVVLFLLEKALRHQHREIGVAVPRFLEALVEAGLDPLPEFVAVRLEHDATANRGVIHQVGLSDGVDVPPGKIHGLRGYTLFVMHGDTLLSLENEKLRPR